MTTQPCFLDQIVHLDKKHNFHRETDGSRYTNDCNVYYQSYQDFTRAAQWLISNTQFPVGN